MKNMNIQRTFIRILILFCSNTWLYAKICKEQGITKCCSNYFFNTTTNQCQICPRGYFDRNCSKKCFLGLFGKECINRCPTECNNTCNFITGICPRNSSGIAENETSTTVKSSLVGRSSYNFMNRSNLLTLSRESSTMLTVYEPQTVNMKTFKYGQQSHKSNTGSIILYIGVTAVVILLFKLLANVMKYCKSWKTDNSEKERNCNPYIDLP
ncbi:uncharacterized protein LOC134264862 [Saccostrea cucullata]|uniref:uncharacterized protein LOC134264862 n=1 Tax=Saccostrea cuccullata TaxID=36930 RepID=UPI002ED59728